MLDFSAKFDQFCGQWLSDGLHGFWIVDGFHYTYPSNLFKDVILNISAAM